MAVYARSRMGIRGGSVSPRRVRRARRGRLMSPRCLIPLRGPKREQAAGKVMVGAMGRESVLTGLFNRIARMR